ncbi:MAG: hypothetical protein AAF439_01980 [Pseudomonadota bacterium]
MGLKIKFIAVDDMANVTLNGHSYLTQSYLKHGPEDTAVWLDLEDHFNPAGQNVLEISAKNGGQGGGSFSAEIIDTKTDIIIRKYHIVEHAAPQDFEFFKDVITIGAEKESVSKFSGHDFRLKLLQIDDELQVKINDGDPNAKTFTVNSVVHGEGINDTSLKEHLVAGSNTVKLTLSNGVGESALRGEILSFDADNQFLSAERIEFHQHHAAQNSDTFESTFVLDLQS